MSIPGPNEGLAIVPNRGGQNSMSLSEADARWSGGGAVVQNTSTTIAGANANTLTCNLSPAFVAGGYSSLYFDYNLLADANAGEFRLYLNSDSGLTIFGQTFEAVGATLTGANVSTPFLCEWNSNFDTLNIAGRAQIWMFNTFITVQNTCALRRSGGNVNMYNSTFQEFDGEADITSIQIFDQAAANNILIGSRAIVYGVT